jgi:large subunit ribosomal protein L15
MGTTLSTLRPPKGAVTKKKRVGRGEGSGLGKTSTRGGKGQTARAGHRSAGRGFEGGQMPMQRRLPKRGFWNPFSVEYAVVNVGQLAAKFSAGGSVDPETLLETGVLSKLKAGVKVLADGEISHPLTVRVHKVSARAREKIEAAGGKIELIAPKAAEGGEAQASS